MDKAVLDERTRSRFAHRQRWHPHWKGSVFERYARVVTSRNKWRVKRYLNGEFEDGLQECAMVFARCVNYYDNTKVDNPAWFMALYKTALHHHWANLATKDSHLTDGEHSAGYEKFAFQNQVSYNDGPLAVAWAERSDEVKRAVALIINAPDELLTWLLSPSTARPKHASANNVHSARSIDARMRNVFHLRPGTTVMTELAQILIQ